MLNFLSLSFRIQCICLFAKTKVVVNLEKSRYQESGGWEPNKHWLTPTHMKIAILTLIAASAVLSSCQQTPPPPPPPPVVSGK